MPYNTRRKSLSLPSLGIHLPVNRSSSSTTNNTQANMTTRPRPSTEGSPRPSKKLKRTDGGSSSSSTTTVRFVAGPRKSESISTLTPPPSAGVHTSIETDDADCAGVSVVEPVDLGGINDEIVEAVILRLQQTRNRPHLVKELATILMDKLAIIQQSVPSFYACLPVPCLT